MQQRWRGWGWGLALTGCITQTTLQEEDAGRDRGVDAQPPDAGPRPDRGQPRPRDAEAPPPDAEPAAPDPAAACGEAPEVADRCASLAATEAPPALGCAPDAALRIAVVPGSEPPALGGEFAGPRPVDTRFQLVSDRDDGPVRWHLEGSVPPGVWIDPCSGHLQGSLEWPGEGELAVVATVGDEERCRFTRLPLDTEAPACAIGVPSVTHTLPPAQVGSAYTGRVPIWNPEGGQGRGRVRLEAGALPPGLALDCDGAVIEGIPARAGRYAFDVRFVEYACGVAHTDTLELEVVEGDPCGGACEPADLCVVRYDGGCEGTARCEPNPLGCAPGACTPDCQAHFCNEGHVCDGESCDQPDAGAFRCFGP